MPDRIRIHLDQQTWKAPYMRLHPDAWTAAIMRHESAAEPLDPGFGQDWAGLETALEDAEILICQAKPPEAAIRSAKRLKWIMATSAGVESMAPFDWLPAGVRLTNNSGTHYPKTREFAGMALAMLHFRAPHLATAQRSHEWAPRFDGLIGGKTVVIVGFGTLGQASAEAARALGLKVRAVKRNPTPNALADTVFPTADLAAAAKDADFLICALPSTPETKGLVGAVAFDALAPGAGVINIGRGPVMDNAALCERLDDGRISGAILDVFDPEPLPPESKLWDQKNLIIFPHMSSDDPTSYIARSLDIFFDNLSAYRAGAETLPTEVDPKLGY